MNGVILYGPPGAGKDTITAALFALDHRYVSYERLKVGTGKTAGYRVISAECLRALEMAGSVVYRNHRYGNVYAIDRDSVVGLIADGLIPVVHIGQLAGILAVESIGVDWLRVLLWCSRTVTAERVTRRGDRDVSDRLSTWDATYRDLLAYDDFDFDICLRTDQMSTTLSAREIHSRAHRKEARITVRRFFGEGS